MLARINSRLSGEEPDEMLQSRLKSGTRSAKNGGEPQENSRCINVNDFAADLQAGNLSLSLSLSFFLCLFASRAPFTRKSISGSATRSIDADSGPDGHGIAAFTI